MKKLTLVLITLGLGFNLMAQEGTALWSGIQIDKKVHKKFEINFNAQVRLADNFSYARTFLAELGAGYKLNKNWEIAAYYRFINRQKMNIKILKLDIDTMRTYHTRKNGEQLNSIIECVISTNSRTMTMNIPLIAAIYVINLKSVIQTNPNSAPIFLQIFSMKFPRLSTK